MAGFQSLIARRYFAIGRERSARKMLSWIVSCVVIFALCAAADYTLDHWHNPQVQLWRVEHGFWFKLAPWITGILGYIIVVFVLLIWRLTIFTTISVFGLFLGTGAMVIVLSVMSGFEQDLKHKILGTNAHIVVTRPDQPFTDYERLRRELSKLPDVVGATPFITNEVMLTSSSNESGVVVKGIDTATVGQVTDLAKNTELGDLSYLDHPEKLLLSGPSLFHDEGLGLDEKPHDGGKPAPGGAKPEEKKSELPPLVPPLPPKPSEGAVAGDGAAQGAHVGIFDDAPAPPSATHFAPAGKNGGHDEPKDEEPIKRPPRPGVIVGRELARSLRVYVGDDVNLISPFGGIGPSGAIPKSKPFRVAGVFFSGMFEYDNKYAYVSLAAAQKFFTMDGEVTGIELKVRDSDRTEPALKRIKALVGGSYEVQDWKELNRGLFSALKIEKILMFVLLCFIILVAAFSIIANGTMMVIEKGREVSILKAMGATDGSILSSFILLGLYIGAIGTAVGITSGVFACWWLGHFRLPLNSDVYYITSLPVQMNPYEIATVFVAALAIALLATLYPAWLAARVRPADGLRDAQR